VTAGAPRLARPSASPSSIPAAAPPSAAQEHAVPVSFWLTILLFVVIGFMLANSVYWSNQRYEAQYRKKRWDQLQKQQRGES
jgi:hypothetical protein